MLAPKTGKKARISISTTHSQHSVNSPRQEKDVQIIKEEIKPFLFEDDLIFYIENPKGFTKKTHKPTHPITH